MKTTKAEYIISQLVADASSIRTLAAELCEAVEPRGSDADKANAIYTIAEYLERKLEELDDIIVELRD